MLKVFFAYALVIGCIAVYAGSKGTGHYARHYWNQYQTVKEATSHETYNQNQR